MSSISEPLRNLTRSQSPWQWGEAEQRAFMQLKQALIDATFTSYSDPNLHTQIIVDAGPSAVSGMLIQISKDVRRVIAYGSKSLNDIEQRYSQGEREAYSCVWACEHFHKYIYGAKTFDLVTDCKSLLYMYGNRKAKLPARIERWGLRLMPYTFKILHIRGDQNPSDYLSRHADKTTTPSERSSQITEEYINFVIDAATPNAISLEAIKQATRADSVLQRVLTTIHSGAWHELSTDLSFRPFYNIRDELCVNIDGDVVLRHTRIVLPESLQQQAIKLAHLGHQGVVRCKQLLRSKVWFPHADRMMEQEVRNCIPCQATTPEYRSEPLQMPTLPDSEWTHLSADF